MPKIDELLRVLMEKKGSDLHLRSSFAPYMRAHGDMEPMAGRAPLSPEECRALISEIIPERNRESLEQTHDADFAYAVEGLGRFRVNVLFDRHGIGAVLRTVPSKAPTADELNLPKVVREFCTLRKGLVLVTGPTGSGKSTTLAAMVDLINKTRSEHLITIEDPIEFVHTPQKCLVTQREVHVHTESFAAALRAALREDPDIVLVGELRDLETMEIAIETAETGHLVFGTLHTNTAASTVERIIDKFPGTRQNQIRSMLSSSLKGVIAQQLCKKKGGGRVAAMEVLVVTSGIASNIRDGKTHQIPSAMQVGKNVGMQLFDDALVDLLTAGSISADEAYSRAMHKDVVGKRITAMGLTLAAPMPVEAPAPAAPVAIQDRRINTYLDELEADPDNLELLNNLAWTLSTMDKPDARHAAKALSLAERANTLTGGSHVHVLDTLSAAYAQNGQFDKALSTARRALKQARDEGQAEQVAAFEQRLVLFERGKPVRE